MEHNFPNTETQNVEQSRLDEKMKSYRKEYERPHMSRSQVAQLRRTIREAEQMEQKRHTKAGIIKFAAAAAATVGIFVTLPNLSYPIAHAMEQIPLIGPLASAVTFRNYAYESDRHMADISVPELHLPEVSLEIPEDSDVQENLARSTEGINAEIQEITDQLIAEFEANMQDQEGYQDVVVKSEVLATQADYFTLKLICYQGAGSGYQWNYYYTIDLNTGERLQLKDLFQDGADYITPISENIKEQMQARMDADENVYYWLNDEIEEWNFKAITDETSFYLNEKDNVVIGFNEGDVAPMYMGTVEFEIPAEVVAHIRR